MYYDAEWKSHILSHKANNYSFCNAVQLQWEKTLNSAEWETLKNQRKVGIFLL